MCFIANGLRKKIAKENIVCYKYMNHYKTDSGKITVQSYNYSIPDRYELNKIYTACSETYKGHKLIIKKIKTLEKYNCSNYKFIYEGFHNYADVNRESNVKCIIPKGSEYYHNKSDGTYVSLKIKFIEII